MDGDYLLYLDPDAADVSAADAQHIFFFDGQGTTQARTRVNGTIMDGQIKVFDKADLGIIRGEDWSDTPDGNIHVINAEYSGGALEGHHVAQAIYDILVGSGKVYDTAGGQPYDSGGTGVILPVVKSGANGTPGVLTWNCLCLLKMN